MSAKPKSRRCRVVSPAGELTPRDRAAAILLLEFGQQVKDVVPLAWEHARSPRTL
jgi:hypothetical protein